MARWRWRRTSLGGEADRAAFRALHNASLASPALREGLTTASAERSVRHLRALLGTPAAAKRHVVYDAGHDPLPRSQVIREILAWLDLYLGKSEK